jgi:hypothetical protein
MRLLITDVTEMHGGNFCVAGWNAQSHCMVRPLPNGSNWTAYLLQQHSISPGTTIEVESTAHQHASTFPHRTEDTPVAPQSIRHVNAGPIDWFGASAPPPHATLSAAFGGHLLYNSIWNNVRQGVYVQIGTQVGSLAAVDLARASIQLVEEFDKFKGVNKLKAILDDGEARYKVAASSLALKAGWRQGGLQALGQVLPASVRFHVRLGLARALGEKCYLMVNGVHG